MAMIYTVIYAAKIRNNGYIKSETIMSYLEQRCDAAVVAVLEKVCLSFIDMNRSIGL